MRRAHSNHSCEDYFDPQDSEDLRGEGPYDCPFSEGLEDEYPNPSQPKREDEVEQDSTLSEELLEDFDRTASPPGRGKRTRSKRMPELAPIPEGVEVSVYERLVAYGLLRKITDIVLVAVSVPRHLREDAEREVHAYWATLKAKPEFERNQVCNYAYKSGQHAALKLRRTIGAVVVLPSNIFRRGRETSFMESIGAAVNPRDIDEFRDTTELSEEMTSVNYRVSEAFFKEKTAGINLTPRQTLVARLALIQRMPAEDIAEHLGLELPVVGKLMAQVTNKLIAANQSAADDSGKPAPEPEPINDKANEQPVVLVDSGEELSSTPHAIRSMRRAIKRIEQEKRRTEEERRKRRSKLRRRRKVLDEGDTALAPASKE